MQLKPNPLSKGSSSSRPSSSRWVPRPQWVEGVLYFVLALVVLSTAVWYVLWLTRQERARPSAAPGPRLELILSGALTTNFSVGAGELKAVACSTSGFTVVAEPRAVMPLELAFSSTVGSPGAAISSWAPVAISGSSWAACTTPW